VRAAATGAAPLLVLAYRRPKAGRAGASAATLDAHFAHIARNFACVLPGDPLASDRLNVCLTFDDVYFDFPQRVLPLLERHDLRALLAVSPGLVPSTVDLAATRLALADAATDPSAVPESLCTWDELRAVVRSGRVAIAAHGLSGIRLDRRKIDVDREIVYPGEFLGSLLGIPVESYRYVFGLGSATNSGWDAPLLNRVETDATDDPGRLFAPGRLRAWRWRSWWNRLHLI
jgi:peptidoglycan/xylan/chitin deacetylase (PgdA/CDA1 family)